MLRGVGCNAEIKNLIGGFRMRSKILALLTLCFILTCYLTHGFAQDFSLSNSEKKYLLNLSRQTLYWYLKDASIPAPDESAISGKLKENRDCFVTLNKKDVGLRGCIGFGGPKSLYKNVIDRTIAAATKDHRFPKVEYKELKDIKIEISVLTEPKEINFDSPSDLLNKIRAMKDGVILFTRYGASTYIPKVWESIPTKERFLSTLCMKHGAPPDTWKTDYKNMKVATFQALAISEQVYGRRVIGKNGAVVGKGGAYLLGSAVPLPGGLDYGRNKVGEGVELAPGAIVTPDSDIIEH